MNLRSAYCWALLTFMSSMSKSSVLSIMPLFSMTKPRARLPCGHPALGVQPQALSRKPWRPGDHSLPCSRIA